MKQSIKRHGKPSPHIPANAKQRAWGGGFGQVATAMAMKRQRLNREAIEAANELEQDVLDGIRVHE